MDAPRDQLLRAVVRKPLSFRAAEDDDGKPGDSAGTLYGYFAMFNRMTTISSWWEGHFRERIAPGAFDKTFEEQRASMQCIYEHGHDPIFGRKPLGSIDELRSDDDGAFYGVDVINNELHREHLLPAARRGLLGASFAFDVLGETWDDEPADEGLPIRTITEARVYEFGPCPFPAYADTSAGVRSIVAGYRRLDEAGRAELVRNLAPLAGRDAVTSDGDDSSAGSATERDAKPPADATATDDPPDTSTGDGHRTALTAGERASRLRSLRLKELSR